MEKEKKTRAVILQTGKYAKVKIEICLEDLFESDQTTAKDRAAFLHNVLGWAATKDLADELRLRGYLVTENK